ncbi:ankyrin [Peniophora sp. CONT]|nr:ankyrin [Peniophora sp. CONT]
MAVAQCSTRNKDGQTALHYAARQGHSEICRVLLDHVALVDATDNDSYTPLQRAEKEGHWDEEQGHVKGCHPDVARVLLEYGAAHDGPVVPLVRLD